MKASDDRGNNIDYGINFTDSAVQCAQLTAEILNLIESGELPTQATVEPLQVMKNAIDALIPQFKIHVDQSS